MDDNLKQLTDSLVSNISNITDYVKKSLEKSLEELKQHDNKLGTEKTNEFINAMKSANVAVSFKDLNDKLNKLRST